MRTLVVSAVLVTIAIPAWATPTRDEMQLPPMSYMDVTFVHPNGCVYTKADPAGFGRRWVPITNGSFVSSGSKNGDQCSTTLYQPMG